MNSAQPVSRHAGACKRNRIGIVVDRGIVRTVVCDEPEKLEVVVIDYDNEIADEQSLVSIRQSDGSVCQAVVEACIAEKPGFDLDAVHLLVANR